MKKILTLLILAATLVSCEKVETTKSVNNDPVTNYEAMWKIMNDHYIFTAYKGVDWDAERAEMLPRVAAAKDDFELFDLMVESLSPFRDGHMALVSDFRSFSGDFKMDENGNRYPENYVSSLISPYLTEKLRTRNNFIFGYIERDGRKYAYVNYSDFMVEMSAIDMLYIAEVVENADGIIFDVRNNGGGAGAYGKQMASHFFKERCLTNYSSKKAKIGSDELCEPYPIYVDPAVEHNWSDIPTVLLVNRGVYSTTNLFASMLTLAPNVTLVGGRTGGGAGMPETYYIPNGWMLCCASNVLLDRNKESIENGVEPDIEVTMTDDDIRNGKETLIEKAIEILSTK